MSHDRSDSVPLAAAEPRCEPLARTCSVRGKCARYTATVKHGSPMGDYSIEANGGTIVCPGFLSAESLRAQAAPARPKKTHPPIGSGQ